MAWPKGRPRPKKTDIAAAPAAPPTDMPVIPITPRVAKAAPIPEEQLGKKRWTIKAAPNGWDHAEPPIDSQDRFHIPQDKFPEGMDLQWVTHSVLGQEMPYERQKFERTGWKPVFGEDFDHLFDGMFMAKGATGEITVEGMVLMTRPIEYSIAARAREQRAAESVIRAKEASWKSGTDMNATGAAHPSAVKGNTISRSYERIDVPKD